MGVCLGGQLLAVASGGRVGPNPDGPEIGPQLIAKRANDTMYGLAASVWTKNIARGRRLAEQIEAGTVMVNEVVYTHGVAQTPWGGVKQSGFGRDLGQHALDQYTNVKSVWVAL